MEMSPVGPVKGFLELMEGCISNSYMHVENNTMTAGETITEMVVITGICLPYITSSSHVILEMSREIFLRRQNVETGEL